MKELDPPLISLFDHSKPIKNRPAFSAIHGELCTQFIEGSCFDLTLRYIENQVSGGTPFLGRVTRRIPGGALLEFKPREAPDDPDEVWRLVPGRSYRLQSAEYINMPPWLMGILHNRTSVFRSNADQSLTFIKPGFRGRITTEVHVVQGALDIQKGASFVSLAFALFSPDEDLQRLEYEQTWQSGSRCDIVASETDPYGSKHDWGSKVTTDGEDVPA